MAEVTKIDADLLAQIREEIRAELQKEYAARTPVQVGPSPVPAHSGGVGLEIADTWSQYEQELARYGEHPSQQPVSVEEPAET